MNQSQAKLAFIGGGNMARSIIGGLVSAGWPVDTITVSDPSPEQRQRLADLFSLRCVDSNADCIANADVVLLAVKPQMMQSVVKPVAPALRELHPLLISIAAGIGSNQLHDWIGAPLPIIRVMPNTPALVNRGVSGLYATADCAPAHKQIATELMQAVGEIVWVEQEALIDVVTAVSGSGPAYFFKLMELMIEQAIDSGLTEQAARTLVVETAIGAATLIEQSDLSPSELRRQVTSPAGTTEAGVNAMQSAGIDDAVKTGVLAALNRSIQLSQEFGENT